MHVTMDETSELYVQNYSQIEPSLYLGDFTAATDEKVLEFCNITHILSICKMPADQPKWGNFNTLIIPIDDDIQADAISSFNEGINFIKEGQTYGSCFVHCFAGISRSATFVAAFLMKKYSMTVKEALKVIQRKRPIIRPNAGFLCQLAMYKSMNYTVTTTDLHYRLFLLQHLERNSKSLSSHLEGLNSGELSSKHYTCKSCRLCLFWQNSMVPHSSGKRVSWLDNLNQNTCEKSMFIMPQHYWMHDILNKEQGKLYCPRCRSKIGKFSWKEEWCACGASICPGFIINGNRVDKKMSF